MKAEKQRLSETPFPAYLQEYFGELIAEYLEESLINHQDDCAIVVSDGRVWLECNGRMRGTTRIWSAD